MNFSFGGKQVKPALLLRQAQDMPRVKPMQRESKFFVFTRMTEPRLRTVAALTLWEQGSSI